MQKADILVMPGIERRDLGEPVPCEELIKYAQEAGLTDVIIIGRERNGSYYVASAIGDADKVVGRLMWAVNYLACNEIVQSEDESA